MKDSPEQAKADAALTVFDYYPGVFRKYFTSPFEQYADRVGQPFTVLRSLQDEGMDGDEWVEDMYTIRFEDGEEIEAWGHEVCELRSEACH